MVSLTDAFVPVHLQFSIRSSAGQSNPENKYLIYIKTNNHFCTVPATSASFRRQTTAMANNAFAYCIFTRCILVWSILNSLTKLVFSSDEHEAYKEAPDTMKGDELWSGIEMPQSSYFEGTTNLSIDKRCSRSLFCCLSNLVPY